MASYQGQTITHLTYSVIKNISTMISTKGFTSKLRYTVYVTYWTFIVQ